MIGLLAGVVLLLLGGLLWLLTSAGSLNQRLLFRLYERLGQRLYATPDWEPLLAQLTLHGGEHLLDIGTASGSLPLSLAQRFDVQVSGIDWSPQMIEMAQQQAADSGVSARVSFEVVDVRDGLPFADASMDGVICLGVVETLADPTALIAEIDRVLKPEGWLLLSLYGQRWGAQVWYEQLLAPNLQVRQISPYTPSYNLQTCQKGKS